MSIEHEKMELRTSIKALDFKRDRVACRIADKLGIHGEFFIDDLNLDDPRIPVQLIDELKTLNSRLYIADAKLSKLNYIDEPERHRAREIVFDRVSLMTLEECIAFLHRYDCNTTLELVEELISNPDLLDEVMV